MEIALSGFNPQLDASASIESSRQRQRAQQEAQQPSSARSSGERVAQEQQNSRGENNTRTPDSARVINGEVLSSETSRVSPREANPNFSSRAAFSQQTSEQADNRRISSQQAVQTFRENEEMVSDVSNPRQVSGIIDEFV